MLVPYSTQFDKEPIATRTPESQIGRACSSRYDLRSGGEQVGSSNRMVEHEDRTQKLKYVQQIQT